MKKIAIIMNDNGYVGRTYLGEINKNGLYNIDVISIGTYSDVCALEEKRCNGLWNPRPMDEVASGHRLFKFESTKSQELLSFLKENEYDYLIQGGTGILGKELIDCVKIGILNFHPGDLPLYRGCSAPEWQIVEKRPVVCTCHFIDEGIDTGAIYRKTVLSLDMKSYYTMRATVYTQIANFMCSIIKELELPIRDLCYEQDERLAVYRKYIGDDRIEWLINNWDNFVNE